MIMAKRYSAVQVRYGKLTGTLQVRYALPMGKANAPSTSYRLRDETRFELEELAERWRCSKTAAMERAIHEAHVSGIELTPFISGPGLDRLRGGATVDDLRAIVAPTAPALPTTIKRYRCGHCGTTPAVARVGEICVACRDTGHTSEPSGCQRCTTDYGTGAL